MTFVEKYLSLNRAVVNRGMGTRARIGLLGLILSVSAVAAAASLPRALAPVEGGLWAVSRNATGHGAERICVPSPTQLAQWESRNGRCTRTLVRDAGPEAVFDYRCVDGSFGHSRMTMITPRTLRIDTQGISNNLPFHYQLHARRLGRCDAR